MSQKGSDLLKITVFFAFNSQMIKKINDLVIIYNKLKCEGEDRHDPG